MKISLKVVTICILVVCVLVCIGCQGVSDNVSFNTEQYGYTIETKNETSKYGIIRYPVICGLENKSAENQINEFFVDDVNTLNQGLEESDIDLRIDKSFEIKYASKEYLSIIYKGYSARNSFPFNLLSKVSTWGKITNLQILNFDLSTGEILPITKILGLDDPLIKYIHEMPFKAVTNGKETDTDLQEYTTLDSGSKFKDSYIKQVLSDGAVDMSKYMLPMVCSYCFTDNGISLIRYIPIDYGDYGEALLTFDEIKPYMTDWDGWDEFYREASS
jgi:hypothetical protein